MSCLGGLPWHMLFLLIFMRNLRHNFSLGDTITSDSSQCIVSRWRQGWHKVVDKLNCLTINMKSNFNLHTGITVNLEFGKGNVKCVTVVSRQILQVGGPEDWYPGKTSVLNIVVPEVTDLRLEHRRPGWFPLSSFTNFQVLISWRITTFRNAKSERRKNLKRETFP